MERKSSPEGSPPDSTSNTNANAGTDDDDLHDQMAAIVAQPQSGTIPAPIPNTGVNKRYRPAPAKTFQCRGYGECRMVFSRSEHLARHIRKHTGERPFTCHCGKQFSRLDNLRQHAQTVHADKQEQNERMMRDLTSLHATMAAANKVGNPRGARRPNPPPHPQLHQHSQSQSHSPPALDLIKQEELQLPMGAGVGAAYDPATAAPAYPAWHDLDEHNSSAFLPSEPFSSTLGFPESGSGGGSGSRPPTSGGSGERSLPPLSAIVNQGFGAYPQQQQQMNQQQQQQHNQQQHNNNQHNTNQHQHQHQQHLYRRPPSSSFYSGGGGGAKPYFGSPEGRGFEPPRGYDARGYDSQRSGGYDSQRSGYDSHRGGGGGFETSVSPVTPHAGGADTSSPFYFHPPDQPHPTSPSHPQHPQQHPQQQQQQLNPRKRGFADLAEGGGAGAVGDYDYGSDSRPQSRRLSVMELCNDDASGVGAGAFLLSGVGVGGSRPGTASGALSALHIVDPPQGQRGSRSPPFGNTGGGTRGRGSSSSITRDTRGRRMGAGV